MLTVMKTVKPAQVLAVICAYHVNCPSHWHLVPMCVCDGRETAELAKAMIRPFAKRALGSSATLPTAAVSAISAISHSALNVIYWTLQFARCVYKDSTKICWENALAALKTANDAFFCQLRK